MDLPYSSHLLRINTCSPRGPHKSTQFSSRMYTVQTYHRILYILVLWWNEPRTNETSWCYPKFLCLHLQHIFPANAKKLKVGDRRLLRDSNLNGLGVCSKVWCWKQDMSRWSHCRLTHGSLVRILFPLANGRLAHWAPFSDIFRSVDFPQGTSTKTISSRYMETYYLLY